MMFGICVTRLMLQLYNTIHIVLHALHITLHITLHIACTYCTKNYMNGVMEQNFAKLTIIEFMYSALMYMRFYCTFRSGSSPPRNLDMT